MRNDYHFWRFHIITRPMPKDRALKYSDRGIIFWDDNYTPCKNLDIYTRWGLMTIRFMAKLDG